MGMDGEELGKLLIFFKFSFNKVVPRSEYSLLISRSDKKLEVKKAPGSEARVGSGST